MKKLKSILTLAFLAFLLSACNGNLEMIEGNGSVNLLIFPYLTFEPAEEEEYYEAYVVEGAAVTEIAVPGAIGVDGSEVPVKVFGGFKNPEDSSRLETLMLEAEVEAVKEGSLDKAESLNVVQVIGEVEGASWCLLPAPVRDGFHFLGWKAGDAYVREGDPIDPSYPVASPEFEAHQLESHEGKEPTCTEAGYREYETCFCGYTTYEEIPALGHDDLTHVEEKDATCTEDGVREHWYCSRCGKTFSDAEGNKEIDPEAVVVPMCGHSLLLKQAVDPTCVNYGNIEYWYCERCGLFFSDAAGEDEISESDIVVGKLPHEWEDSWSYDGDYHWHECIQCHNVKDKEEHYWILQERVEPTADEDGKETYLCGVCNDVKITTLPATGHEYTKKIIVEPTCTEKGYTRYDCSLHEDCGKYIIDENSYVPALGHDLNHVEATAPTCEKEGNKEYWYCDRCNVYFSNESCTTQFDSEADTILAKTEHAFRTYWDKDEKSHWHECSVCGEKTDISEHEYNNEVASNAYIASIATCTEPATYYKSCVCGQYGTETFAYGDPLGHELVKTEAKVSTCEEHGNIEYWTCGRCHLIFRDEGAAELISAEDVVLPLAEHTFSGNYEVTDNSHKKICGVCGDAFGEAEKHIKEQVHDSEYHWDICSICNHALSEITEHTYEIIGDDKICTGCGYVAEDNLSDGGFEVGEENTAPDGTIKATDNGNNLWSFEFVDKNPEYPPTKFIWSVNGVEVEGTTGSSFEFKAEGKGSYLVMCVFFNDSGVGSADVSITGR